MRVHQLLLCIALSNGLVTVGAEEWNAPMRHIPVPLGASPELQSVIASADPAAVESIPETLDLSSDQIREMVQAHTANLLAKNPELIISRDVKIEQSSIGGVNVYHISPNEISDENEGRLFIFTHGGAYVYGPGEAGLDEPMLLAARLGIEVLSIDYRMPPDHPYPAAVDDVISVYRELIENYPADSLAFGGSSAGGGILLSSVQRFRELGLPMPGALFAGTPWADLSNVGDSLHINHGIDQVLLAYSLLEPAAKAYANGIELTDKRISPVYGDFEGFPPTIIVSGTRDLFLSHAVRVHRKLRDAGVPADLHVYEGISHATYMKNPELPESINMYDEIQRFISEHVN